MYIFPHYAIFFHVFVVQPPRCQMVGERRGEEDDPAGAPADICWDEGEDRGSSNLPGLLVVGQTERKPPSPLAHPNPTTFSSGHSLLLTRLHLLPGSNHSFPLILLLLHSGQCPILWDRPGEAVEFLSSWPCLDRLHRVRPPTEPPQHKAKRKMAKNNNNN